MTSISPANSAALFILRQVDSSSVPLNDKGAKSATDKIAAIANGISGETSTPKAQASSAINKALLDRQENQDGIVSNALAFLDSENFKTSDAGVTDVIKRLISEDGAKFASLVNAEKAKGSGMTSDNAMANAIRTLIRDNRSQFGVDEFVIGFKLSNGGAILDNIEDINGNSTSKTLMADLQAAQSAVTEAAKVIHISNRDNTDALRAASAVFKDGSFTKASEASSQWLVKWMDAFGLR